MVGRHTIPYPTYFGGQNNSFIAGGKTYAEAHKGGCCAAEKPARKLWIRFWTLMGQKNA